MLSPDELADARRRNSSFSALADSRSPESVSNTERATAKEGTSSQFSQDIREFEGRVSPVRRSTLSFPLKHLNTKDELETIEIKNVNSIHDPLQLSDSKYIQSSYPEEEGSTTAPETSTYLTPPPPTFPGPPQQDLHQRTIDDNKEVFGDLAAQKSLPFNGEDENYLSNPKIRTPMDSEDISPSAWSEGKQLIEQFGYVSGDANNEDESPPSRPISHRFQDYATESEAATVRQLSTARSHKDFTSRLDLQGIGNGGLGTSTAAYSAASVAAISSKRGSLSRGAWVYGDVDNVAHTSTRSSRSDFSFHKSIRNNSFNKTKNTGANANDKKKTVGFNENDNQPPSPRPVSLINSSLRISPWICAFAVGLFLILMIYATFVSIRAFSPYQVSKIDVIDYFDKLNLTEKQATFKELINSNDTSILNGLVPIHNGKEPNNTDLSKNVTRNHSKNRIQHIPRPYAFGGTNSFSGINPKYQGDYEIRELMEDNRLFNIFYGLAYAPRGVIEPMCGATERDVMLDTALLSRVTTRVRTYGTQCRQAEYILNAIEQLHLNLTLALGVWIGPDDYVNWKQMNDMKTLLNTYPRSYFDSIFIGNEVMFRQEKSIDELMAYVDEARRFTNSIGYNDIPIGTSELGSQLKEQMFAKCDFIGANIHPFFGGERVESATQWALDFLNYQVIPQVHSYNRNIGIVVSEVGWPSGGGNFMDAKSGNEELQYFLESWNCNPQNQEYGWFYFEGFDEPWKKIWHEDGSKWETEWGFFTHDRKMKPGVQLPDCARINMNRNTTNA